VAYCSIVTLLLAFFIILQAFATEQRTGLFYAGQGSFVRALETFGLGGLWDPPGARVLRDQTGARYLSANGQTDPPDQRRIDPEAEDAQKALASVSDLFDVQSLRPGSGWRVSLPGPFDSHPLDGGAPSPEEVQFCRELARRIEPLMLARGFVIRVGTVLQCTPEEEPALIGPALAAADGVRKELLAGMSPAARQRASMRVYSFCHRDAPLPHQGGAPASSLRIELVLTKPYADKLKLQETGKDAPHGTQ
jgi:hypothetical protein